MITEFFNVTDNTWRQWQGLRPLKIFGKRVSIKAVQSFISAYPYITPVILLNTGNIIIAQAIFNRIAYKVFFIILPYCWFVKKPKSSRKNGKPDIRRYLQRIMISAELKRCCWILIRYLILIRNAFSQYTKSNGKLNQTILNEGAVNTIRTAVGEKEIL